LQLKKQCHVCEQNRRDVFIVFFKHEGIVHHEYAPQGQIINQCSCLQILRSLCMQCIINVHKNGANLHLSTQCCFCSSF
jgi:hypothetical protein